MMNGKFVAALSGVLAKQLLQTGSSDEQRVERAWVRVLGHGPNAEELRNGLQYLAGFPAPKANDGRRLLAWTSYCRSLIASNDFMYVY